MMKKLKSYMQHFNPNLQSYNTIVMANIFFTHGFTMSLDLDRIGVLGSIAKIYIPNL